MHRGAIGAFAVLAASATACGGEEDITTVTTESAVGVSRTSLPAPSTSGTAATAAPPTSAGTTAVGVDVDRTTGTSPCAGDELPSFAAFDVATGEIRWTLCSVERTYRHVVAVTADVAFVQELGGSVDAGTLAALDITDGSELWRTALDGFVEWSKGEFAGGGVVVLSRGTPTTAELVGLDAGTGAERWSVSAQEPEPEPTGPQVVNGTIVIVAPRPYPEWSRPVAGTDEIAVVVSDVGRLAGIDRTTGQEVWSSPVQVSDESGDVAGLAAAAVLGDTVILPAGSTTVAVDARTGAELWRGESVHDPWAADDAVVGARGGATSQIAALDGAGGETRWEAPGQESYGDVLAVGDGGTFVTDPADGSLIAYDLESGAVRWRRPQTTGPEAFLGQPQAVVGNMLLLLWESRLSAASTTDGSLHWGWHQPVGSDWMSTLGANDTTVVVAVNSLPFSD